MGPTAPETSCTTPSTTSCSAEASVCNGHSEWRGWPLRIPGPQTRQPRTVCTGPKRTRTRRLVVWRVGTVMDNHAVAGDDPQIIVNVCVEWWPMWKPFLDETGGPPPPDRLDVNWMQKEYGYEIGRSLAVTLKGPTVKLAASDAVVLQAQAAAKTVATTSAFQTAFDDLNRVDEAFGDALNGQLSEALKALEDWLDGDTSATPPSKAGSFYKVGLSLVTDETFESILDGLSGNAYNEAIGVARNLVTVLSDKPTARALLTEAERELVSRAQTLLLFVNTYKGIADRIEQIQEDSEQSDALLSRWLTHDIFHASDAIVEYKWHNVLGSKKSELPNGECGSF